MRELVRRDDVQDDGGQQDRAHEPKELAHRVMEEVAVGVHLLGPLEHLQVPDHVADHKADADQTGDGHDDLLADLRIPERSHAVHSRGCLRVRAQTGERRPPGRGVVASGAHPRRAALRATRGC
jgi:hypothetical protein